MPYDSEANYSRLSPSEVAEARRSSLAATVDLRDGGQQRWHEEVDDEIRMVEFRNARPLQHEKGKSFSLNGNTKVAKPDRSSRVSTEEPNLDNPFVLFETVEELDAGVELLASKHGLSPEVDGLKRAAHFEMDEMDALNDPTFPENEKTALQNEREATFWQQTRDFRSAVLIVGGLSGICQGWTQSILNGTSTEPKELALYFYGPWLIVYRQMCLWSRLLI